MKGYLLLDPDNKMKRYGSELSYKDFREMIGGHIELVHPIQNVPANVVMLVNEEGKNKKERPNRFACFLCKAWLSACPVLGSVIFAQSRDKEILPLTRLQIMKIEKLFQLYQNISANNEYLDERRK